MDKIRQTINNLVVGVMGFIIIASVILAALWLKEKLGTKATTTIQLSADDVLERLAQSDNYEIKCDKNGDGRIAFAK